MKPTATVDSRPGPQPPVTASAPEPSRWNRSLAISVLLPVTILALAAFYRLYQLDSIPPGLWRDEGRNGIDAVNILHGITPMFFEEREPLYMYFTAGLVAILGQTDVAIRLISALVGIGAVGLTYALAHKLFGRWVAVLAGIGLATSFWAVDINRLGLRANAVPFFALLSFWFLWAGLQRGEKPKGKTGLLWPFALSGVFLGISFYTYLSSRLLPLVFIALLAWMPICRRLPWRRSLLVLFTVGAVSLLVFVPLGLYFLAHPEVFLLHAADMSFFGSGEGKWSGLYSFINNIADTLGMFTFRGDANWRHNIQFRPVFDPVSSVFFIIGILYAVYRIRRPEFAFLLFWIFAGLLPGILSINSPHYLRTLSAAPVAYILAAVGISQVGVWASRLGSHWRFSRQAIRPIYGIGVAGLLAVVAVSSYRDYFQSWATNPQVYTAFEADVTDSAKFLNTVHGEPLVFASAVFVPHPVGQYLVRAFADLRWYDSFQALVIPPATPAPQTTSAVAAPGASNDGALFILLGERSPWLPILQRAFPAGTVVATGYRPDGVTSYIAFRTPNLITAENSIAPAKSLKATLEDKAQLVGYEVEGTGIRNGNPTIRPGETLTLTLYWKPLRPVAESDLKFFTHFADAKLGLWGQMDDIGYQSSQWRGGELTINRFALKVKADAPPGKYTLRLGMYAKSTMDRLIVMDGSGRPTEDVVSLPPIKVTALRQEPPAPQKPSPAVFDNRAKLLGYDLAPGGNGILRSAQNDGASRRNGGAFGQNGGAQSPVRPGDKVRVTLYWQGLGAMKEDYTVFLHLSKPSGEVVAQADGQPAEGSFPTSFWDEGDYVTDPHGIAVPASLAAGEYDLSAGMYLLSTGERLKTDTGADEVKLGTINIK